MISRDIVVNLIEEKLADQSDLFLVSLDITSSNKIDVVIDGDNGVNVTTCIEISRQIENNLDRESDDFALTVSSAGLDKPLSIVRQYKKNIGRDLEVTPLEGKPVKGTLLSVDESEFTLEVKTKERLEGKKKKVEVVTNHIFSYAMIKKAIVVIVFK